MRVLLLFEKKVEVFSVRVYLTDGTLARRKVRSTCLRSRVLLRRQLGRRGAVRGIVRLRLRLRLRHRLSVVRRRIGRAGRAEPAVLRLIMRERDGRVLCVRRSSVMRRRVILAKRGLSTVPSRRLVVVRTRCSTRVVGRTVWDHLPPVRDDAALADAADELFRVPVALGTSRLAICLVVASDVLPLGALATAQQRRTIVLKFPSVSETWLCHKLAHPLTLLTPDRRQISQSKIQSSPTGVRAPLVVADELAVSGTAFVLGRPGLPLGVFAGGFRCGVGSTPTMSTDELAFVLSDT